MKRKTAAGFLVVSGVVIYRTIFDLGSRMLLARILTPEIFGSFTYVFTILGISGAITTLSSHRAIGVADETNINKTVDTGFTVELLLASIMTLALFIFSPLLMALIKQPELSPFMRVASLNLVFAPFSIPFAISSRKLNIAYSNIRIFANTAITAVVSVCLAFAGAGLWSLILGVLAGNFLSAIVAWIWAPYRPHLRIDVKILAIIVKFGLPLTITGLIAFYYWNVDYLLVGRISGMTVLGYYWIAFKIPHYIGEILSRFSEVTFFSFAKLEDKNQRKIGFELLTKATAAATLPILVFSLHFAPDIITILFGKKWLPSVPTFRIFMVVAVCRGIVGHWLPLVQSLQITRPIPALGAINAFVITFAGYFMLKKYGITGMAWAVFLTLVVTVPIMVAIVKKHVPEISYTRSLLRPLGLSGFLFFAGYYLNGLFFPAGTMANFFLSGGLLLSCHFLLTILIMPDIAAEGINLVRRKNAPVT